MKNKLILSVFVVLTILFAGIFSGCTMMVDNEESKDEIWNKYESTSTYNKSFGENANQRSENFVDLIFGEKEKPPTSFEDVSQYIKKHKKLPSNYILKETAIKLGYNPRKGNLYLVAPGKSIGGNIFANRENLLPSAPGRVWREADIDYVKGYRNSKRIVYSNDGLIYKTTDHYKTFKKME